MFDAVNDYHERQAFARAANIRHLRDLAAAPTPITKPITFDKDREEACIAFEERQAESEANNT